LKNDKLKNHIIEIIDNQMRDNDPKCTTEVFEKLVAIGYAEDIAKKMIGAVLVEELYYVLKSEELFNEERYRERLYKLPALIKKF
jgi:Holliday junction resolvasome RuvABC DNA-binding subunit